MVKRKKEDNKTAIIEVIQAGTLRAYAPTHLKNEIIEHLPKIAEKKDISLEKLHSEWESYQQYIEFIDVDDNELVPYKDSVDPKDAPFVILAEMLNAAGIISKDPHIEKLGGKRVNFDIRVSLRDYSRTAAIVFSLRIGGVAITYASVGLILALGKGLSKLMHVITNLPDRVKMILLIAVVLVFVIPSARTKLFDYLQSLKGLIGSSWETVSPTIMELFQEANEKGKEAGLKLDEIQSKLS